jgi:hypothetical protein
MSPVDVVEPSTGIEHDRRWAAQLREWGPGSPQYVEYALKLRNYGIGTLTNQWNADQLRRLIRDKRGISLPPPLPSWDRRVVPSIIGFVVCAAVEPFLERAVLRGGWKPERGATIRVYFVGRCHFDFATQYRKDHDADRKAAEHLQREPGRIDLELDVVRFVQFTASPGPEPVTVDRAEIRQLLDEAPPKTREMIFLTAEGVPVARIADRLQMSEAAVRSAISRFQKKAKRAQRRTRWS